MEEGIRVHHMPPLNQPILIAGFDGWGNALNVSEGMAAYLIRELGAEIFAELDPDLYFRYDSNRPIVEIEAGEIRRISLPKGGFYRAKTSGKRGDIVILKSREPNLHWRRFAGDLMTFCKRIGVKMIITVGAMYDNVLHSDRFMSGIASDSALSAMLKEKGLIPITYKGPSAIHSVILTEGQKMGYDSMSIWCHCPYYLEGITHFGLLSHLGSLLASIGDFDLNTADMEKKWKELNLQIQELIEKNPQLQEMLSDIRKEKVKGSWKNMKDASEKDHKIINLADFIKPGP